MSIQKETTIKEIAALINADRTTVIRRAKKENWPFTEKTQRGGRVKVFNVSDLPDDIRILYNKEQLAATETLPLVVPSHIVKFFKPVNPLAKAELSASITPKQKTKALGKFDLLRLYNDRVNSAPYGQKVKARDSFLETYNAGLLYPELFKAVGPVSWKTIEGWKRDVKKAGNDGFVLADTRGAWKRGLTSISPVHEKIILACLLHPHAPRIAEGIRYAREIMNQNGIENGFSEATYRRWITWWKERNFHIWTMTRYGAKRWNDECAPYAERDYDLIGVGDMIVGDGHVLNFEIINPWTGKPKRMMLMLWYDMKSNFPLGWEILPNENTQGIASAMRWAIIRLGKIPTMAYTDNGKAFRSKFMEGDKKKALSDTRIDIDAAVGMFERLGIKTINAIPYHGQSKPIERFFGSFSELERWAPTFTGTSIEAKPPGMMRGEKLHRKLRAQGVGHGITLEQAYLAIAEWFDRYVTREQQDGHLKGLRPIDVFEAGRGPGVDREMLNDLMMSVTIRSVRRSAISFTHPSCESQRYYHPALHGRTHKVMVQYDFQDPTYIRVSELTGELICVARPYEKLHPAATYLGTDEDKARLSEHCAEMKRLERQASSVARDWLRDEVLPAHKEQMARIGIDTAASGEVVQAAISMKQQKMLPETTSPSMSDEEWAAIQAAADQAAAESMAVDSGNDLFSMPLPEVVEDAAALRSRLESLPEDDRYIAIMEMEIKGQLVPERWRDFARYFEDTLMYLQNADYFEGIRGRLAVEWQSDAVAMGK